MIILTRNRYCSQNQGSKVVNVLSQHCCHYFEDYMYLKCFAKKQQNEMAKNLDLDLPVDLSDENGISHS